MTLLGARILLRRMVRALRARREEVCRISEENALRARLRARPGSPVEPDEPIPTRLPLPEVDFPSATEFPEFFLVPADLSDGDDDDAEDEDDA